MIYLKFKKVLEASFSTLLVLNLISFFFVASIASNEVASPTLASHLIFLGAPILISCSIFTLWSIFLFKKVILPYIQKIFELEQDWEREKVATQIAHDLKSPLAVLEVLNKSQSGDEKGLLPQAISRIQNITNDLLEKQALNEEISICHLLEEVFSYKALEYPELKLMKNISKDFTVKGNRSQLSRIFSNLINNSVEANASEVTMNVGSCSNIKCITCVDNGTGLSPGKGNQFFNRGTSSKLGNHGLGLSGAKAYLKELGANISLRDAALKKGATVEIKFY